MVPPLLPSDMYGGPGHRQNSAMCTGIPVGEAIGTERTLIEK